MGWGESDPGSPQDVMKWRGVRGGSSFLWDLQDLMGWDWGIAAIWAPPGWDGMEGWISAPRDPQDVM